MFILNFFTFFRKKSLKLLQTNISGQQPLFFDFILFEVARLADSSVHNTDLKLLWQKCALLNVFCGRRYASTFIKKTGCSLFCYPSLLLSNLQICITAAYIASLFKFSSLFLLQQGKALGRCKIMSRGGRAGEKPQPGLNFRAFYGEVDDVTNQNKTNNKTT